MRVAVVAGPDPGHAFPAIALCLRFLAAGDTPTLFTGVEWLDTARGGGMDAVELAGLDPTAATTTPMPARRSTSGPRGWRCSTRRGWATGAGPGGLRRDHGVRGAGGRTARLPWIELSPHPLYLPSKGLPPLGSGLAPGIGSGAGCATR